MLLPAWQALVEHLHAPIPSAIQFLIGQTGQMVRTASIQDHRNIARDLGHADGQHAQGNGHGSGEMSGTVFLRAADIHQHLRMARIEFLLDAFYADKSNGNGRREKPMCIP